MYACVFVVASAAPLALWCGCRRRQRCITQSLAVMRTGHRPDKQLTTLLTHVLVCLCLLLLPAASAVFHKSPAVMAAALKFFLGQDAAAAGDDEGSEDEAEDAERGKTVVVAPTKEEVYKATHKVGIVT